MAKDTKKTKKERKSFFKDFRAELKKVVWPTPKQLVNNTAIVIGMILITAAIVFCLDVIFDNGYQFIVDKSETVIQKIEGTNNSTENAVEEANAITEDEKTSENATTEGTDE